MEMVFNDGGARPPPIESPNPRALASDGVFIEPGAYSQPARTMRSRFAAIDDVVMLRMVNAREPWASSKVMAAWEAIATELSKIEQFGVVKNGPAVKSRFDLLRKKYKEDDMASMKKSGVDEEFEEREQLLCDICERMLAYEVGSLKEKQFAKSKADGIENSGVKCRQFAMMTQVEQRDQNDENGGETEWLDDDDDDDGSNAGMSTPAAKRRRPSSSSSNSKKISRNDRLNSLMDGIATGIASVSDNDAKLAKIAANQAIEQARVEAAIRQEELRLQHEERMQIRREEADRERDAKQQQFLLKLVSMMTNNQDKIQEGK